jgi:hypothetical protein
VNPKSRPTISTILEKPFIKKKVAAYIYDFIQSYKSDPKLEADEMQCEILKEQAEKLGVFNSIMKEISNFEENNIFVGVSSNNNNSNFKEDEMKYANYLKKKESEKNKIEEKILELEKQKKQIYANIRGRVSRGKKPVGGSNIRTNNRLETENFSPSVERKGKIISSLEGKKKSQGKKEEPSKNKIPNNSKARPESQKKSYRKVSQEINPPNEKETNDLIKKEYSSHDNNSSNVVINVVNKVLNNNIIPNRNRPLSSINPASNNQSKQQYVSNAGDSFDENLLETIKEEQDENIQIEKNKIMKLTKEIIKMKEQLEKTQSKIDKIKQSPHTGLTQRDFGLKIAGSDSNHVIQNQKNFNSIDDEYGSDVGGDKLNREDTNSNIEKPEDDGTGKLIERVKFLKHRCESALGYKLFIKAYDYLKVNRKSDPLAVREHLISKIY